jgi:hypothetical protein
MFSTLYKSGLIELRPNKKGLGYYAKKDIKRGTLLLFEQLVVGKDVELAITLHFNPEHANKLYPRKDQLKKLDIVDLDIKESEMVKRDKTINPKTIKISEMYRKAAANLFFLNNKVKALGYDASFFNHKCQNNAGNDFINENDANYIMVHALSDIPKYKEISTNYDHSQGHERTDICKCKCQETMCQRKARFKNNIKVMQTMNNGLFPKILEKYEKEQVDGKMYPIWLLKQGMIIVPEFIPELGKTIPIPMDIELKTNGKFIELALRRDFDRCDQLQEKYKKKKNVNSRELMEKARKVSSL